jgi:hypothetical protein
MAEKRMFSQKIIDSDHFLDMPLSTQAVYFHLSMRADDEGFINNPKKIVRMIGASDDEIKLLIAKNFVLDMNSGVVVIKHWHIHNHIRKDRLKSTSHTKEKALLSQNENGSYTLGQTLVNQDATKSQHSIDKNRLDKISIEDKPFSFSLSKLTSVDNLSKEYLLNLKDHILKANRSLTYDEFINGLEAKGSKYKNFKSAYTTWANNKDKWDKKDTSKNNKQSFGTGGMAFTKEQAMNLHNMSSSFTIKGYQYEQNRHRKRNTISLLFCK